MRDDFSDGLGDPRPTGGSGSSGSSKGTGASGRLMAVAAWAVLLLGLWLWGLDLTEVRQGRSGPVTGDMAAVRRGLDRAGAIEPPPFEQAGAVGWYAAGAEPGAAGAALMVGHVDTETRPAVFYKLSTLTPGRTVRVVRDDGRVAEFTVEGVQVLARDHFDARQAYGVHRPGRAELRLITCGGAFDRAGRAYTANVVVSAYLTGTGA